MARVLAVGNNWYTPFQYTDAASRVMGGGIDLDPASCAEANETVQAHRYYTEADNGLLLPWRARTGLPARVFCNPPYGRIPGQPNSSLQSQFVQKFVSEYDIGNVREGILLCAADPDERWYMPLWRDEFLICFTDYLHKIWFNRPGLKPEKHIMGTCFVYLGDLHREEFIEIFSEFGNVIQRLKPRKVVQALY